MIYLFSGDDAIRKIKSYEDFLNSISSTTEELFIINKNDFTKEQVEALHGGAGLFFKKCTVVFVNIFESTEAKEFLLSNLKSLQGSANDFVFLEGKLPKSILDIFRNHETKIKNFDLTHAQKEKFNNFLLANAFGSRDKFSLWLYFRQAIDKGVGMEELVGVLFWKIKDMLLKRNFAKWQETELQKISTKLAYLLPEARKKGRDDEAVFEAFLLEAF